MIRNIVFDVGNVLAFYRPDVHMKRLGFDQEEQDAVNRAMFQHSDWNECDRGEWSTEKLLEAFISHEPSYEAQIREAFQKIEGAIEVMPYTVEWLKRLKEKGYALYIISNYGEYTYERTRKDMTYLPYMDGAIFSFQERLIKPDIRIYQRLCEQYGLRPEECVFLDDRMENVEGARKAGFYGIQFFNYQQVEMELGKILGETK